MTCSNSLKSIRILESGSPCHPLLVFGRASSNYMATDRNNGSNGRGAERLSRRQLNHAQSVGESVDQFAKYVVAIYAALDSKEFIDATFQLLQAATPGCFASTMLRHIDSRGALWMSSNGLRLEAETIEHFYRDHPGYHFLRGASRNQDSAHERRFARRRGIADVAFLLAFTCYRWVGGML